MHPPAPDPALDECRRRVQQDLHGHRGQAGDPLYKARRTLHTGAELLTDKQKTRLDALFADEIYQNNHRWQPGLGRQTQRESGGSGFTRLAYAVPRSPRAGLDYTGTDV